MGTQLGKASKMEVNFNIAAFYRLEFGHDEKSGKNAFKLGPLEDNHCIRCNSDSIEDDPMKVWAYYQVKMEPYEGGMKTVFNPIPRNKLLCELCAETKKTKSTQTFNPEPASPERTDSTSNTKKRGGRKPGSVNKKKSLKVSYPISKFPSLQPQ